MFYFLKILFWSTDKGLNSGPHTSRQAPYCLSHSPAHFCVGYFQNRISQTLCPDWQRSSWSLSPEELGLVPSLCFTLWQWSSLWGDYKTLVHMRIFSWCLLQWNIKSQGFIIICSTFWLFSEPFWIGTGKFNHFQNV
jgi:hypothetical protein